MTTAADPQIVPCQPAAAPALRTAEESDRQISRRVDQMYTD